MLIKKQSFFIVPFLFYLSMTFPPHSAHAVSYLATTTAGGGNWVLLQESIGISAMHMQVLKNNKVIMFDRTDFGPSNLSLPAGKCRNNDLVVKPQDCTAHSIIYDIVSNTFRPLTLHTDTWCSSGSLDSSGNLIQTGGYGPGEANIRTFIPCDDEDYCDWVELTDTPLWNRRWYASNQILPDGRIIIVGGRRAFTYEFYPKNRQIRDNSTLPFLLQTRDREEENNLYPFLHLLPDGNLFIFANNRSISFDYRTNKVVKEFPVMPVGTRRNYPCTGSSVLLPLRWTETINGSDHSEAEVMICGGAKQGAYIKSTKFGIYEEASRTCGRLKVTDPSGKWVMELMPSPRVMNDILLLPTGDVIIINGAANGSAGWDDAVSPVFNPVLYSPDQKDPTRRFVVLNGSRIARLYHSAAALLPDGRVLVGGSNPHPVYNFTHVTYPTELSLEAFYPPYLDPRYTNLRPSIMTVDLADTAMSYAEMFSVTFVCAAYSQEPGVSVTVIAPSFTTHSFGMNQRMVVLKVVSVAQLSTFAFKAYVIGPANVNVAPPGFYMLFVVHAGIPSQAVWVNVG